MDSKVHKHFDVPNNIPEDGNFKAKCKHCPSIISGSTKATSNFITHMKRKHRELLTDDKKKTATPDKSTQSIIPTLTKGHKYSANDPKQRQITEALVCFIAGDLIPLSVVESNNFRTLIESSNPKYQMPSRKHLSSKLIHEKSSELKSNLMHQMKIAENVCLTLDLWTNRQMRGFLGITGHYILNWTLKSVMIACARFKGKHTGERIRQEYEEVVACYEIGHKISNIVSDNASNMVKAFDFAIPGFQDKKQAKDDDCSDKDESVDEDEFSELETADDTESFECLPKRSSCYAHSLQLVVKDGLNQCGSHLKHVITKASNIVNHVRKSTIASEILENEKRLQASNSTRWNSQFYMLKSVLNVKEEKLNSINCSYKLSTYERNLQELCTIPSPFEKATLEVQRECTVSASSTIPVTLGLKHQMNEVAETYSSKMISTFQSSIEKRLHKYLEDESYIIAAVLDPRFKLTWCDGQTESHNIDLVRRKVDSISKTSSQSESPPLKRSKPSDNLFSFLATKPRSRHTSGAFNELDSYLTEDCIENTENPLGYWSQNQTKYPTLAKLAERYLALPASSAPCERLFSIAGKIFRPERCRLTDTNFEALMMIKCNKNV